MQNINKTVFLVALDLLYARIHKDGHCQFNRHFARDGMVCESDVSTV